MPRTLIPFSSGSNQEIDPKMLPNGAVRAVRNLRLRRGSQLAVRRGFEQLDLTHESAGNLVVSDLLSFSGRLLALASTEAGTTAPCDLLEYTGNATRAWRRSVQDDNSDQPVRRICSVTNVRNLGRLPLQGERNNCTDIAAALGRVLVLNSEAQNTTAHLIDVSLESGDTLLAAIRLPGVHGRTVALSNGALLVALADGTLGSPGTTVTISQIAAGAVSHTTFRTLAVVAGLTSFDMVADGDGVAIVQVGSGGAVLTRIDSAGTLLESFAVAVAASATVVSLVRCGTNFVVGSKPSSVSVVSITSVGPTGVSLAGPTVLGATTSALPPALLSIRSGDAVAVLISSTGLGGTPTVVNEARTVGAHAAVSSYAAQGEVMSGFSLASNPIVVPDSTGDSPYLVAGIVNDEEGRATNILVEGSPVELVSCSVDRTVAVGDEAKLTAGGVFDVQLPSIARDASTGRCYWPRAIVDADQFTTIVACEFDLGKAARRQYSVENGELYLSGGALYIHDTRVVFESGFVAAPVLLSLTESGTDGALTPLATYQVAAVFEWTDSQGKLHQSAPSSTCEITLTGSNNRFDTVVSGALSSRGNASNNQVSGLKTVLYRTLPAPDVQLQKDVAVFSGTGWGVPSTIPSVQADDDLADERVVYTQGSTGIRSGPNPHVSPLPCSTIWPRSSKNITGGLPDSAQVQESREAFPNEPISWAANLGGIRGIRADVLAVASLDERRIVFTSEEVFSLPGEGLDINGVGDVGSPTRIPSPCGIAGTRETAWQSLVETDKGLMYLGVTGLIYLLPRGGGAPHSVGDRVEDALEQFPNVVAATYIQSEQMAVFACNSADGTASTLLMYDVVEDQWLEDSEPAGVLSVATYRGRLAVLRSDRTVHLQLADGVASSEFIETEVETGDIWPFGQGMEGQADTIQLVGEVRGDCVVSCLLSTDSGSTYQALSDKVISGRQIGSQLSLSWQPDCMLGNRFRIRFVCRKNSGPSEGIRYNFAVLHSSPSGIEMQLDDEDRG